MQGLRASDRSSLKPLAVAALALAAVAAPTVPAVARVTGWSEPAPASARCTEGSPFPCARQLLVSEVVIDDRAGPPTVLIRAQWQPARSGELMRLSAALREACGHRQDRPCGRTEPHDTMPATAWVLAAAQGLAATATPVAFGPEAERAEPMDLLLGGPWTQACEIDARGSSCPRLEPAQARLAALTAQRHASYAVAADIQRRPGWGEALLVRLTRQLE